MQELTEKQKATLDRFDQFAANEGLSANMAAIRMGLTGSVISAIRTGKYQGNIDDRLSKVDAYLDTKRVEADTYQEPKYVPTYVSSQVYESIRTCKIKGGLSLITGDSGVGKTKGVQEFCRQNPIDSIAITANPCIKSTKAVLKMIAAELGAPLAASAYDLWINVLSKLHDGMVIIIDEGQLLSYDAIETVRAYSDFFKDRGQTLGLALVGSNEIRERIEGEKQENYDQVRNRSWQRPFFKTQDVKYHDIERLFPILTAKDATKELTFLYKVAQGKEGVRGAVNLFSNAYDEHAYDLEGLAKMAKKMRINLTGIGRLM